METIDENLKLSPEKQINLNIENNKSSSTDLGNDDISKKLIMFGLINNNADVLNLNSDDNKVNLDNKKTSKDNDNSIIINENQQTNSKINIQIVEDLVDDEKINNQQKVEGEEEEQNQQHHQQQNQQTSQIPISKHHHSKNSFFNLFHIHHSHHHHHNSHHQTDQMLLNPLQNVTNQIRHQSENTFIEYSSEALLQYTKEGNFSFVREILNCSETGRNVSKLETIIASNYNTISGDASTFSPPKKLKIDLEVHDEAKQTPLILAARFGFLEIASLLISHGADVNATDMDSWCPLLNSAKEGHSDIVTILLEHKSFIECRDCGGFTPLMWACYKNKLEVVKILISHGANVNAQCKNSICCLSWAAGRGYDEIVIELLKSPAIKVNLQDRNSSTPLLWAARKGSLRIITALVEKDADPEMIGMNSMTPLIMCCKFGHVDSALYLSGCTENNINHLDKDGNSALSLAAKNGYTDVVLSLLDKRAYVNKPNKKGDSILITAVKGSHKPIVEALLNKQVDIDAIGNQGKTALNHAIEKGNIEVVRVLLAQKPSLETVAQDGDTLLLLAVKRKSTQIVNELLNSGSRVSPTDKNGDNVLHIALRNRSRDITELILANPKNSKYLYKPNKHGETPHKIDASNPKSILGQIFGARQLNMTEDSILGYDLYSSALAEILSEPSLHTPITVGLYAKWGSGKSFLLAQLRNEMKSFAKLTRVVTLKINLFLILTIIFLNLFIVTPFFFWKWSYGLMLFGLLLFSSFFIIGFSKFFYERKEKEWAERMCDKLSSHLDRFKLLLKVLFLNPNVYKNENLEHKNLRFIFTEYGKISTIGGENALALMIGSLCTKIEDHLGLFVTRMARVFYNKSHSRSKFKRFCCIPTFILVILVLLMSLGFAIFFRVKGFNIYNFNVQEQAFVATFGFVILLSILGSSVTSLKILWNLIRSPKSRIMRISNTNKHKHMDNKVESFIFKLKREVDLIAHTIKTIDTFSHSLTRLVIIIDGLDSCEQSKVLQILEIIHVLFTREGDPFISILAVDPHVLIKGIEGNLTTVFRSGSVNGHDYLKTIIHLPVFLQVDLTKAKALSKTQTQYFQKRHSTITIGSQDALAKFESEISTKKKKGKNRRGTSSSKPMSTYDLTDQLMKSDYFLDVNPLNLRRLINIIVLTGRLLRAYHIDFNWRQLAFWIYLIEQWPYRCSWIIMYYEEHENEFTDETGIFEIYERIKNQIPITNEPLLELDRNARKFEKFIQECQPSLNVTALKRILPCLCNLDPYLIKLIKESIDAANERTHQSLLQVNSTHNLLNTYNTAAASNQNNLNPNLLYPSGMFTFPQTSSLANNFQLDNVYQNNSNSNNHQPTSSSKIISNEYISERSNNENSQLVMRKNRVSNSNSEYPSPSEDNKYANSKYLQIDMSKNLNEMSVDDVCESIDNNIDYLSDDYKQIYKTNIKDKNINGRVLYFCDLDELKGELQMSFGDWYLFKNWVLNKRQVKPIRVPTVRIETPNRASNSKILIKQQNSNESSSDKNDTNDSSSIQIELNQKSKRSKDNATSITNPNSSSPISLIMPASTNTNIPQLANTNNIQQHQQNRKVEFFITPVIEVNEPTESTENSHDESSSSSSKFKTSPLILVNPLGSRKTNNIDDVTNYDVNHLNLPPSQVANSTPTNTTMNNTNTNSKNNDQTSLSIKSNNSCATLASENQQTLDEPNVLISSKTNLSEPSTSSVSKLGKKIFKSIDNLFHKSPTASVSSLSHHQKRISNNAIKHETSNYEESTNLKDSPTKSSFISNYSDEENDEQSDIIKKENENNQHKQKHNENQKDHFKMQKLKKSLFNKSKKQNQSKQSNNEINSLTGSSNKIGKEQRGRSSTTPSQLSDTKKTSPKEEEITTYFIFDEDDDLI